MLFQIPYDVKLYSSPLYGTKPRVTSTGHVNWEFDDEQMALLNNIAAITYYQVKEISRVIKEHDPAKAGFDVSLLAHISPIEWSNVILYGQYKLNRDLVK